MATHLPSNWLEQAVRQAIEERIELLVAEAVEAAQKEIARKIPDIIAAASLATFGAIDLARDHRYLIIKVELRTPDGKSK